MRKCENCGAPVNGCKCEYCGGFFDSPDNKIECTYVLYADDAPYIVLTGNDIREMYGLRPLY